MMFIQWLLLTLSLSLSLLFSFSSSFSYFLSLLFTIIRSDFWAKSLIKHYQGDAEANHPETLTSSLRLLNQVKKKRWRLATLIRNKIFLLTLDLSQNTTQKEKYSHLMLERVNNHIKKTKKQALPLLKDTRLHWETKGDKTFSREISLQKGHKN